MSKSQKVQIFTQRVKVINGIPKLVLVDQKVSDEAAVLKKLEELQKSGEAYIEVQNEVAGVKTIYTKKTNAINYTEKDIVL